MTGTDGPAIAVAGIAKSYARAGGRRLRGPRVPAAGQQGGAGEDRVRALSPFDLTVARGQIVGILGPDGAGKSTLLRILATLLLPDQGRGTICGHDLVKDYRQVRRSIGYMPQRFSLYPDLSVFENMRFFAEIFGLSRAAFRSRMEELLAFNMLEPFLDRRAGALSGGMKQKLALSCILIHTPELLILDEPTTGVDPVSRAEFWEILGGLRDQGVPVLVTTPYMDEAQHCDRICLLHEGARLAEDAPERIVESFPYALAVLRGGDPLERQAELGGLEGVVRAVAFGDRLHLYTRDLPALASRLAARGLEVTAGRPTLEDVFVEKMGETVSG